jgi:hypothetical protein
VVVLMSERGVAAGGAGPVRLMFCGVGVGVLRGGGVMVLRVHAHVCVRVRVHGRRRAWAVSGCLVIWWCLSLGWFCVCMLVLWPVCACVCVPCSVRAMRMGAAWETGRLLPSHGVAAVIAAVVGVLSLLGGECFGWGCVESPDGCSRYQHASQRAGDMRFV